MKLAIFLLFVSVFSVQASGLGQTVSLKGKDLTYQQVFAAIKQQTGYLVFGNKELLTSEQRLTLEADQLPLREFLALILTNQPYTFDIDAGTIFISRKGVAKKPERLFPIIEVEMPLITGMVLSADGSPLPGATVTVKGTQKAVVTDNMGNFSIDAQKGDVLVVSCVGFIRKEFTVGDQAEISITLEINQNNLEAVVVTKGYYSTSKKLNTGSVSTVKSEVLQSQPVGDPLMALSGRVPGLYISQNSGVPGASLNVMLRGRNSIANGNDPLYIIDGVPFTSKSLSIGDVAAGTLSPFSVIGIDNIEKIDVLKDADATAIYGSRGANGVILISTKKGKAGKTELSFNANSGFGKIVNSYNLMNTQEYLDMRREAFINDGLQPGPTRYDVNGAWDEKRYTDWEKILIGNTARLLNTSMSLSGGNAQTQFLLSGQYRNETTVFAGDYRNQKISFQSNINHASANHRFKSNLSVMYTNDNNRLPTLDITPSILTAPNAPAIYNEDGSLNWENSTFQNPLAPIQSSSVSVSDNLNGALNISYEFLPGLLISNRAGFNSLSLKSRNISPATAFDPGYPDLELYRSLMTGDNTIRSWIMEPTISYANSSAKHKLDVLVGVTTQYSKNEGQGLYASGYTSDALIENIMAASGISAFGAVFSEYRYSAIFARLGYAHQQKYILNLTGRRDGSSRFGRGNRFGNFGAAGAAWVFSNEKFIKDQVRFLQHGKLRFSYGVTGNDQLPDYRYLSTYASSSWAYQGMVGLNPTQHTNPAFGWETVHKLEAALELGFWNERLLVNVNWYRNRTANQLVGYPLPSITGFNTVQANLPAVIQNTGLEIDATAQLIHNQTLTWIVDGNVSIPRNKLVSFPNIEASSYANIYRVGMPLNITQRYRYTGINSETGVYTFEDRNGDGLYTTTQDRYPVIVGQQFFGGINNRVSFRGVTLDLFLQYVKQTGYNKRFNSPGFFTSAYGSNTGNLPRTFLDRWQRPGDEAVYQRYSQQSGPVTNAYNNLYLSSDAVITNASFIRLKNISLSWDLSPRILAKVPFNNIRIYAQAQNVLTITPYRGVDPEISRTDGSIVLPPLRMFTAGFQFTIQ